MSSSPARPLTQRAIFLFWLPLASTWVMMAAEGPFLAAIVARLPSPEYNLGAYGVTFAFAILVEAPVIMLMTASTALAKDATNFRRLRRFGYGLNVAATALLLLVLIPGVYDPLMYGLMALPEEVAHLAYVSLWIMLPWPAAIGYRRFYHGLLIRDGKTRLVALGTLVRLVAMASTALILFLGPRPAGAYIAAAALATGVVVEAVVSRWMARPSVRVVLATPGAGPDAAMSYRSIGRFYLPLALTSFLGLAIHPMVTFFMGRSPAPVESLAVLPVVNALVFVFRSMTLAYQEVTIALMGERFEHVVELRRFTLFLGGGTMVGLALVGLTPLSAVWFEIISGLSPELAAFAIWPTIFVIPLPFLGALVSFQRGILVNAHVTRPITAATLTEVITLAVVFPLMAWGFGLIGVTAAAIGFTAGRVASVSFLIPWSVGAVRGRFS